MRAHFQAVNLSKLWPVTVATETGIYHVTDGNFALRQSRQPREITKMIAYLRSAVTGKHYLYEKWDYRNWGLPRFEEFSHVIMHYSASLELLVGRRLTETVFVLDTHNNEREYFQSVAANSTNSVKRRVIGRQVQRSERLIANVSSSIAATISVSESDRDWVQEFCVDGTRHFVVPNNLFQYDPTTWSGQRTLLYVGTLNVTMNLQALDWFLANVWPSLQRHDPRIKFVVAGRDPSPGLVANLVRQGVTVVPNAPSLRTLYEDATVALIPAFSGSGGKIKVGEALAHGVPVITTRHGLVGQPSAIGDCCTVCDEPQEWIEAILDQLARQERTTAAWNNRVRSALEQTYFGNSINQIARYLEFQPANDQVDRDSN
ncbi:glycosyltransferase [Mycolicibacterium sp. 22603]|uniref:glycosyltransferase n=1 Tax=Mycolicibacterium sp. 22603 TaxID=3453950 RepID=UPI003F83717D